MSSGDFVAGSFLPQEGEPIRSRNPATGEWVAERAWTPAHAVAACEAAEAAGPGWRRLSVDQRWEHLCRFRDALAERKESLADALVAEVGKIRSEARAEVAALVARFDRVRARMREDLHDGIQHIGPAQLRYGPLGVVGVIGPFNYPLHLCHAHVLPALLAGNPVVIKPSEVTLLAGERYAQAAEAAGLPDGVINVVMGGGSAGAAIAEHAAVRGLCFTGSWAVGEKLLAVAARRPELLLALEMGGKNTCVVLDDADVRQAAHEIAVGAFLTTGQRCTATDRVLVHESVAEPLIELVAALARAIRMGDPEDAASFAGPLTTEGARAKVAAALAAARAAGAVCVAEGSAASGSCYAPATVHRLPAGVHHVPGYTDTEIFGPDVGFEVVSSDEEALSVLAASEFGLANSVFTASDERFETFVQGTRVGIINRNRSTNQASGDLPFGGVGKSGNYRPAGSFAQRNVTVPMAVQELQLGEVAIHPQLAAVLPDPDLGALEARFEREEEQEATRNLVDDPRPIKVVLPRGGALPQSKRWLTRLYAGARVVAEKKPPVFDHLRSWGPWMVSIDDEPLSVLDGMSQTATLTAGFAADAVVRAYFEGEFGATLTHAIDTSLGCDVVDEYAAVLRDQVQGLPEVTFTNSGAEANDKALGLARLHCRRSSAERILAFEGSFHGRTLWPLGATYNPSKREPYQVAGYQATFAPFPVWPTPNEPEPEAPAGFYAAAAAGDVASLVELYGDEDEHGLLAREVHSLDVVARELSTGSYFACIVEPMQSEGGDRYATARFFRALRLVTRAYETDLIFDEVQTGFGLGGGFAWHTRFRLVNHRGQPDYPDAVTWAKRAQVGVVTSRYADPEPTPTSAASLVRGRIHAETMATSYSAGRIEKLTWPRLQAIAQAFPELVSAPRAVGYAIAFDLPTPAHLNAYIGQRFWRGAVVFAAGSRTVRYRLSESYETSDVERLFVAIRQQLAWLEAHPGEAAPAWHDGPPAPAERAAPHEEIRIRTVASGDEALELLPAILDIEYRVYEPARQTPPQHFRPALAHPDSIVTVAEALLGDKWHLIGFGVGAPLELVADIEEGPDHDFMLGRHNTLYSVSITVSPEMQGRGLGRAIKSEQLRAAMAKRKSDGTPRYSHVTGRNRVGHTASMRHLNRVFGAHILRILTGQYADPEGQAAYYRIPLAPYAPTVTAADDDGRIDARSIAVPLSAPPPSLRRAEDRGLLYGPAVNKLTIMNYVTTGVIRALEWVQALLPAHPRLYLTSSRDETVDKSLRILRTHRPAAQVAIGLDGGYVGHTTAAARSISDPRLHAQGPAIFDWPRVPHPALGLAATIAALDAAVASAGGADKVFGLFVEAVGERSGLVIDDAAARALSEWSRHSGVPIVAVEGATAFYRSGRGPFALSTLPLEAAIVTWWGGAQAGYIHVNERYRVDSPLTMVSTWDGDELSLVREYHQLRHLRTLDLQPGLEAIHKASDALDDIGMRARGAGLYRVIDAGMRADDLVATATAVGLRLRAVAGGQVLFCPGLDVAVDAASRLRETARRMP